ncbi:hypothetical protein ACLK1Y_18820 [Escherichia coli]
MAIDRHQGNQPIELVHYPQPLLREADNLAKEMAARSLSSAPRHWACDAGRRISIAAPTLATPHTS